MPNQGQFKREDMVMSMNPEIKARWTAALRSGEYEQGTTFLNNDGKLCCLGVLCDLAVKDAVLEVGDGDGIENGGEGQVDYGQGDEETLPASVRDWAGLVTGNPLVDMSDVPEGTTWKPDGSDCQPTLAGLNDDGTPFSVIADIIDAQL